MEEKLLVICILIIIMTKNKRHLIICVKKSILSGVIVFQFMLEFRVFLKFSLVIFPNCVSPLIIIMSYITLSQDIVIVLKLIVWSSVYKQ